MRSRTIVAGPATYSALMPKSENIVSGDCECAPRSSRNFAASIPTRQKPDAARPVIASRPTGASPFRFWCLSKARTLFLTTHTSLRRGLVFIPKAETAIRLAHGVRSENLALVNVTRSMLSKSPRPAMSLAGPTKRDFSSVARFDLGNGGLIVTGGPRATRQRNLIVSLAARHKLIAVYFERLFTTAGGLISYGPDYVEQYRLAAGYVDRILKGEKPADLPVQAPTKFELVINLKTAIDLGLDIPQSVLARADEVIE